MEPKSNHLTVIHYNSLFRGALSSTLRDQEGYTCSEIDPEKRDIELPKKTKLYIVGYRSSMPQVTRIENIMGQIKKIKDVYMLSILPSSREDLGDLITKCIKAGTNGCISEEEGLDKLLVAIERVISGKSYCSQLMTDSMFKNIREYRNNPGLKNLREMSPRERQVIRLISEGSSNKEIANALKISPYTVKNHVHNILDKLQVKGRREAGDVYEAETRSIP